MEVILSKKCFLDFLELIHELTGITIANNRTSMVEGRLRKRVMGLKLASYEDYFELVKKDKLEQVKFVDLVTTNETYFYRTPCIWDYIENTFLPSWFEANPKGIFTGWSAASSSGEEAHTLGIICQAFKEKHRSFRYQIAGTDISEEMVELCRQGNYTGRSIGAFQKARPELFEKYMKKFDGDSFQVIPEIKKCLKFQQHNLFKPFCSEEKFSLVLVRNVLIYFTGVDQEKVISLIAPEMATNGVMIIGESESLAHINTNFRTVAPFVYKQNSLNPSGLVAS